MRRLGRDLLPPVLQRAVRGPEPTPGASVDHRRQVGGLWEELGRHQFDFLVGQGLEPHHRLLDVGCGSLRGGVHFVGYLDPGHYFGVDIDGDLLAAGEQELEAAGLGGKAHTLRRTDTFEVDFGRTFDFVLAQSVFTHLPLNSIQRCLLNVDRVLAPTGRFFATFFFNPHGKNDTRDLEHRASHDPSVVVTHMDRDPYHYAVEAFEWACSGTGLVVEHVGEWGHPWGQQMLMFHAG